MDHGEAATTLDRVRIGFIPCEGAFDDRVRVKFVTVEKRVAIRVLIEGAGANGGLNFDDVWNAIGIGIKVLVAHQQVATDASSGR